MSGRILLGVPGLPAVAASYGGASLVWRSAEWT